MNTALVTAAISLCFPLVAPAQEKPELPVEKAAAAVTRKLIATTYGEQRLHLVGSDGSIQLFALPKDTVWGSGSDGGSNDPLLSPDGKSVAFIRKGTLTLRPLKGGKDTVAVTGYPHEEFLLTGWSPDGGSIVYFLGPPQAEDPPPSKITEPQHFVYDLKSRKSRRITVPGQLAGWLPGGEMLLWQDDGQKSVVRSLSLQPGSEAQELLSDSASFGQVTLSPDGTRIAASISARNDTSSSQIFSIELATGKRTALREPAGWAEIQWPRWSPSGKRTAWEATVKMKDGIPENVIVVDGKPVTAPASLSGYFWLTDDVIAVAELDAVTVISTVTGKEIGRKKF